MQIKSTIGFHILQWQCFVNFKVLENEVFQSWIMIGDFFDSHIKLLSPKLSFILLLMIQYGPWFTPLHEKVFEDTVTALLHQIGAIIQMGAVSVSAWLVF